MKPAKFLRTPFLHNTSGGYFFKYRMELNMEMLGGDFQQRRSKTFSLHSTNSQREGIGWAKKSLTYIKDRLQLTFQGSILSVLFRVFKLFYKVNLATHEIY